MVTTLLQKAVLDGKIPFGPPTYEEYLLEETLSQLFDLGRAVMELDGMVMEVDFREQ